MPLRLTHGPAATPLEGITGLEVRVEQAGEPIASALFGPDPADIRLPNVPFGDGLMVRVDVLVGALTAARGFSFPVDVGLGETPRSIDVHVGKLGRFSRDVDLALDGPVAGAGASPGGALIATTPGTLYRYDAHGASDGAPSLERVAAFPEHRGARWASLAGGLVAVGGDASFASLVGPDGQLRGRSEEGSFADQRHGAALATLAGAVVVLGGAPIRDGGATELASHVAFVDGALLRSDLPSLPCAVRDVGATAVAINSRAGRGARVVTVCHDALRTSRLLSIDPRGEVGAELLEVPGDLRQSAWTALSLGVLMVAGGRDVDGAPTIELRTFAVGEGVLETLTPAPRELFDARVGAAALQLGEGLALLVGGRGVDGQGLASSELVTFPRDVALTGPMLEGASAPRLVRLGDRSVLIADQIGVAVYVVPRETVMTPDGV